MTKHKDSIPVSNVVHKKTKRTQKTDFGSGFE